MDHDEPRTALKTRPPSHIALPPPPSFSSLAPPLYDPSPDTSPQFHTAPSSPALLFYTPPTSPLDVPAPDPPPPPPSPPALHINIPTHNTDDPFPTVDLAIDLALDDDGLSTLEKIYLFSRSKASFHRVFITHALPDFLRQVTPQEAIEYVLPLLSGLAMDEDEQVKEALAAELVALMCWFFTNCKIIPDDPAPDHALTAASSSLPDISVQAFTPILGTLLLSANPLVGGAARNAIVDLLSRLKKADDMDAGIVVESVEDDDHQVEWSLGSFNKEEREMVRNEILQQVVIGMGRLDVEIEDAQVMTDETDDGQWNESNAEGDIEVVAAGEQGNGEEGVSSPRALERARMEAAKATDTEFVNSYFPVVPTPFHVSSPASSAASTPSSTNTSSSSSSSSPSAHPPGTLSRREASSPSPLSVSTTSGSNSTLSANVRDETKRQGQATAGNHSQQRSLEPPGLRATSAASSMPLSPTEESWSGPDASLPVLNRRQTDLAELGYHTAYDIRQDFPDNLGSEEAEEDEQAAVGRLSSMSLMAAVTASGALNEEAKETFVKEVVRVGQDSVYWVRREASFALGALAKVVPEEVVICSLLPLFDNLRHDPVWHVRHSALFALPAILSRLSPKERHSLALNTIITLSTDESPAVRSGVLEALGEVLYTFHQDSEGPPEQLVQLFLGRKEDRRVRDGQQCMGSEDGPLETLYSNPERPLICAFNYPAVALTLGRERWGELREVYLDIAANRGIKVRRTLAASLGELAKIVGTENAQRDLVGVWWDAIRCEEEEVRTRAAESLEDLLGVVGTEVGESMVQGLVGAWDEGRFRGWREREGIAKGLGGLGGGAGRVGLLKRALEDSVAAVREAGVGAVAEIWQSILGQPDAVAQLRSVLQSLAVSSLFRRRMTFIACQQALATHPGAVVPLDDDFWTSLVALAADPIVGVRIGLARLVGSVSASEPPTSPLFLSLVIRLSQDPSHEVQSYIRSPHPVVPRVLPPYRPPPKKRTPYVSTFSRPPPPIRTPPPLAEALNTRSPDVTSRLRTYNGSKTGRSDSDHPMDIIPFVHSTDSQHTRNSQDGAHDDPMLEGTISSSELMPDTDIDVNPKTSMVSVPA
ncbi:hypothetical protein D9615_003870 [Tricholomella constricta]|uniref:ARM repeat-containing protein n=1 Tax=Tricholomella constricta TaxID=117010 RepID=A0A8H5HD04_9AGAR|nr:hypothetical protein D9615_003870 [Tricholomella constricta]